jgi:predicted nucleotidyltransferase
MSSSLTLIAGAHFKALESYASERDTLLQNLHQAAESDERIAAVWLFGSLGRGDEDELSDIDIVFVVQDAHLADVIDARYGFLERMGELLLVQEAPQNAPPGGAYNMAVFAAPVGPHTVDCYWRPVQGASVPPQSRLLFDRVGLPAAEDPPAFGYQPVPEISPEEAAARAVQFFWVMALITAKYVGRSPFEEKMGLLQWVLAPLSDCERFVGHSPAWTLENAPPHAAPTAKTRLLRDLVACMESLTPLLADRGVNLPAEMPLQARRYLDFIDAVAALRLHPAAQHDPVEPSRG